MRNISISEHRNEIEIILENNVFGISFPKSVSDELLIDDFTTRCADCDDVSDYI